MTLLSGENITKQFEDRLIFDGLSFSVNDNDRIGLVGPNGIGKTTLFEMIVGRMIPDTGNIVRAKNCRIGYVEQEFGTENEMTLFDYVSLARQDILATKAEIGQAERALEENPDSSKLIETLGELQNQFENTGGYSFESEIKMILIGLGFPDNRFHNRLTNFSGGEKNRASLARILAGNSNLLLLDEPTNHLDIESTIWLEEYLRYSNKAYIAVSHDRAFLNNTINKVWELTGRKIEQYYNGFEKFLAEREERKNQIHHLYRHQQEEIKRIEDFIRRNMAGQKTKQAQSKMKYLARIKRIELPQTEASGMAIRVESGNRSFNLVLSIEETSFGYGNQSLVASVNLNIYRGDKVGLIGRNGSGKTTILKSVLGEIEILDGSLRLGQKVDVAYFDQELSDLNDDNTVLDELWQVDPLAEVGRMRAFLARFGFRGEDVLKKIAVLSGGEKTKLALSKLLFQPANFLIFDEPTNHLDIDSRLALEEALANYNGTCLIVSHDRYFLDRVASKIAAVENGTVAVYGGNYSYYREKQDSNIATPTKKATDPDRIKEYESFKKQSQLKGKLKKDIRSVTSKIADHERILARLEDDINYNISKTAWEKLAAAHNEKSRIEEMLLKLYHELEELNKINAEYTEPDSQSD